MHEEVRLDEAHNIIKKPRAGLVAHPFKRPKFVSEEIQQQPPPNKRPRTENNETGT